MANHLEKTGHLRGFLLTLSLLLFLPSCQEEDAADTGIMAVTGRFHADIEEPAGATRTLLTAPGIETLQTAVTLAAYSGGKLSACGYYTSGLSAMPLSLIQGWTYNVYALVNMGDLRNRLPVNETSLANLEYSIPAYTGTNGISVTGIPMAGIRKGFKAGTDTGTMVPVQRLLAKVTVDVHCTWPGPQIRSVEVRNLNKTLRPFGRSAITSPSDRLTTMAEHSISTTPGATFTAILYVPENLQGTVDGISGSFYKTGDHNASVADRADFLTYIETTVTADGTRYEGEVRYRSYLGDNAVDHFDIERNSAYVWNLTYTEDGLQYNDWKHATDNLAARILLESIDCYYYFTWNWNTNNDNQLYENEIIETIRFMGNYSDGVSRALSFLVPVPCNGLTAMQAWNDELTLTTQGQTRVTVDAAQVADYLPDQRVFKAFDQATTLWFRDGLTEGEAGHFSRYWHQVNFVGNGNSITLGKDRIALYGDSIPEQVPVKASGYLGVVPYDTRRYTVTGSGSGFTTAAIQYSVDGTQWTSGTLTATGDKTLYVRSTYAGPTIREANIQVASADGSIVKTLAVTVCKAPDFVLEGHYGYTESENEDQDGRTYVDGNVETFHLTARKDGNVIATMPPFLFVFQDSVSGPWTQYTSTNPGTETPLLDLLAREPSIQVTIDGTQYRLLWKDIH